MLSGKYLFFLHRLLLFSQLSTNLFNIMPLWKKIKKKKF